MHSLYNLIRLGYLTGLDDGEALFEVCFVPMVDLIVCSTTDKCMGMLSLGCRHGIRACNLCRLPYTDL